MTYNSDQQFYDAYVELEDATQFEPNTWQVYAFRLSSHNIPSTFHIGTYFTETEAIEHANEINKQFYDQ